MKFNEPVRPAGIGRKQVAFDIGQKPSLLSLTVEAENTQTAPESTESQNIATMAQATKIAKVAAYSAASSAIVQGQNEVWGIKRVATWTHSTTEPTHIGTSYIHWDGKTRDENYGINSSLAYVDTEDPTIVRVRKNGWYLVNVWFRQTAWQHNNSQYTLYVLPADSPDSAYTIRDLIDTDGYPILRLSTIISIPGSNNKGTQNITGNISDGGGIQMQFYSYTPGKAAQSHTMDNTTVEASCQIAWLRPYEDEFTYNFA